MFQEIIKKGVQNNTQLTQSQPQIQMQGIWKNNAKVQFKDQDVNMWQADQKLQLIKNSKSFNQKQQKYPSKQILYGNESEKASKRSKAQNLISQILDYEVYKQKNLNPQFLRIKNNILLIMLLFSSFGIYYLFEDFLDVMLLAFIGGVGYQQMRERFIKFWTSDQPFFQKQMTLAVRILSVIGYLFVIVLLPWVRVVFGHPGQFWKHLILSDFIYYFSFKVNLVVLFLQIFLLLKVLHLILAPKVFPIIARHTPKSMKFYKWAFGFVFTLVTLAAVFIIPSVLAMEVSHGGSRIQQRVQEHFQCRLINYANHHNTTLPLCSQIFLNNNTFFQQTLKQFKAQTSQVQDCMTYLFQLQRKFISYQIFQYKELTCTWYLIIQKASSYLKPNTDVIATSTRFFQTIFGNIAFVVMSLSNIVFAATTFVTIFYVTVAYFDSRSTVMQQIFFGERKQLLGQITNLIQATLFIVVEHFLLSIVLLQLFNFSNFNMIISTFLSSMAFVPFFRPWIGALFFCVIRSAFIGNHFINIIFVVVYYYSSQRIFSSRFKQMEFHEIIMNLSILFGIYQFGIAGIFYGPIIIILFKSVHRQLLRNQVYTSNQGSDSIHSEKSIKK